jgi:hypothetical protein
MISFVTAIKLVAGYEDFVFRLKVYMECIAEGCRDASVPYEIVVVEDVCRKNLARVHDSFTDAWLRDRCTRVIECPANYPNPNNHNMIEAYAKNVGIRAAVYPFVCVTSCDVFFNRDFFVLLRDLKRQTFYRFLQYETLSAPTSWEWRSVKHLPHRCFNAELTDKKNWSVEKIAYKSGDIMLTDKETWNLIKGFPENIYFVHSDLIVCQVISNNGIPLEVPPTAKVVTYPQGRSYPKADDAFNNAKKYITKKTCN